jgi:hypothetical protein
LNHGLFADLVLLEGEDAEALEGLLQEHLDRFQPADDVEEAIVHQICAAQWRLYRVLSMETQALNKQIARLPAGANPYYLAEAYTAAAALPSTTLLQRYESRLQLLHQRALRSFKLLRTIEKKIEPSPITEQPEPAVPDKAPDPPPPPQPTDSEELGRVRFSLPTSLPHAPRNPAATNQEPAKPPADPGTPPPSPKEPGGAV